MSMAIMRTAWRGLAPTRLESLLFVALMSGPPKFRFRDLNASLTGALDWVVVVHIAVWLCGGLWVLARLYPSLSTRGIVPAVSSPQAWGALLIASLCLSLWHSPGFLLTAYMIGQLAVMLAFAWIFVDRYGPESYLRHLFAGVWVLTAMLIASAYLIPDLVFADDGTRFRGEVIAPTGPLAAMGLVFCLSSAPRIRPVLYWAAIVLFGVLLVMSRMRTAYAAFIVYVGIGVWFGGRLRIRSFFPLLIAISLSLVVLDAIASTRDYIVRDTTSLQTLSDRVPLWGRLTTAVMRDGPVVGLGYYAATRVLAPRYNERLGNAHSAFFEFLVGGGLVSAALYLALCASLVWSAWQLLRVGRGHPDAVTAAGLLVIALVGGLTGSDAVNGGPVGFTLWSLTALLPALHRRAWLRAALHTRSLNSQAPQRPARARADLPSFVS